MQIPRYHILIIDEYPDLRHMLYARLIELGHVCTLATTAEGALQALDRGWPDLVFLEFLFRDGSGSGLSTQLREKARQNGHELFIVAHSIVLEPEGFRARESVDDYLWKLADPEEFELSLGRYFPPRPRSDARWSDLPVERIPDRARSRAP